MMSAVPQSEPSPLLIIRDGIASIPAWGWDSTQSMICGIPVRADVNAAIPVIPQGGTILSGLYLTFPNGWVLALTPLFADTAGRTPAGIPLITATAYVGEANRVFDPDTLRSLDWVTDTVILDSLIREVAGQPAWAQDDLIARYIAPSPRRGGIANVVVVPAYIPVWALVGAVMLRGETLDEIAGDYGIPPEAVRAAFAYYQRHRTVIDARIDANNVGDSIA